jgi:membrane dipeptidase
VFATLYAPPERRKEADWEKPAYQDTEEAFRIYRWQMENMMRLCDSSTDKFRLVHDQRSLAAVLENWKDQSEQQEAPVGLVLLMEGAEAIGNLAELEGWWQQGLRLIGPAWAGNRFCGGTYEPGPLTDDGRALLEAMAALGFALDISHMDTPAALEAADRFEGAVCASHANVKALLKGTESNRHLTDEVIVSLLERDAVIGVVPYNLFLHPDWRKGMPRELCNLEMLVDHVDHICQMAGDALHVGLGSDFDGGFGLQSVPPEIDSLADLQKIGHRLADRGYRPEEIEAILSGNWLNFLSRSLPLLTVT